jgi:RNA polymerase sigma-70 factor (ECF subfamily)
MEANSLLRLLLSHRRMLLGYILSIVRDVHLSEDVFQAASLVILKKGPLLTDEADFAPWARKIVRFEALNMARQRHRGPELLEPAVLDLIEPEWGRDENSESVRLALQACIETLRPKARRLIELRYVAGFSGKALAAKLNQPANTIYVALSRIYRKLSNCVQKRMAYEG